MLTRHHHQIERQRSRRTRLRRGSHSFTDLISASMAFKSFFRLSIPQFILLVCEIASAETARGAGHVRVEAKNPAHLVSLLYQQHQVGICSPSSDVRVTILRLCQHLRLPSHSPSPNALPCGAFGIGSFSMRHRGTESSLFKLQRTAGRSSCLC